MKKFSLLVTLTLVLFLFSSNIVYADTASAVENNTPNRHASSFSVNKAKVEADSENYAEFTVYLRDSNYNGIANGWVYVASERGKVDRIVSADAEKYKPAGSYNYGNGIIHAFQTDANGKVVFKISSRVYGDAKIAVGLAGELYDYPNRVAYNPYTYLTDSDVTAESAQIIGSKTITFDGMDNIIYPTSGTVFKGTLGEIIKIPIAIKNARNLAGGQLEIAYPHNLVELVNIEKGNLLKDFLFVYNPQTQKMSFANATDISGDDELFILNFKLIGRMGDTGEISLFNIELNDQNGNGLLYENETRVQIIISSPYGDINKDGWITAADATLILRAAENLISLDEEQIKSADVNGDGKITKEDAEIVLKYVVELINTFPIAEKYNG